MSGLATALMPVSAPAGCDLLDARDFPDRDALIVYLVVDCGWSTTKVGTMFRLSSRHTRRIAQDEQAARQDPTRHRPQPLTPREAETMLREYRADPLVTPEEREAAERWLRQPGSMLVEAPGLVCRGIEDFCGSQATGLAAQSPGNNAAANDRTTTAP